MTAPPRLAWFSPMPPVRSGVATNSAELIAALRARYAIDVFVDQRLGNPDVESAHEFVRRHHTQPYDVTVYQLGNSSHHNFIWPYLFRHPGLTVLHDAQLHHARAAALLTERRFDDYRAEFAASQPDVSPDLAELGVAGFDSHLYYMWPMTRLVIEASKVTAVHAPALAEQLRVELPGAIVEPIRLAQGQLVTADDETRARREVRGRYGIPAESVLFGMFGGLSPDKRVPQILAAFAAVAPASARLILAGAAASHFDVEAEVDALALRDRVTIAGYVDTDATLTDVIAACDVSLNLRWPTAREMSGPWLRALAAGTPTVTIDLAHLTHVPSLDPRTWQPNDAGGERRPVTVAIDILDEDHSLRLALRRLALDPDLRRALGTAAREYWQREHSLDASVADYERVIDIAVRRAAPRPALPPHLSNDGTRVLRQLLQPFDLPPPL